MLEGIDGGSMEFDSHERHCGLAHAVDVQQRVDQPIAIAEHQPRRDVRRGGGREETLLPNSVTHRREIH